MAHFVFSLLSHLIPLKGQRALHVTNLSPHLFFFFLVPTLGPLLRTKSKAEQNRAALASLLLVVTPSLSPHSFYHYQPSSILHPFQVIMVVLLNHNWGSKQREQTNRGSNGGFNGGSKLRIKKGREAASSRVAK